MHYYAYENWRAHGHRVTVHRATCSFCNEGKGVAGGTRKDNGRWFDLGAHITPASAFKQAQKSLEAPLTKSCGFCCRKVSNG